tara:strand:- start:10875 stop:12296 length:1422 start_codon:yes stop_codon:yes gene_type:complete
MTQDSNNTIKQEINKAINFLGQNKFSEAENICNKIIDEHQNPDAFHILASIKIYKQEFKDSIKLVKKSINLNSKNPGYYVTLGCAYSASQDYEKSIIAFKDAININNTTAQVHFYLGESYRKLKKYNDALSSFYKTIELSPDHLGASMLLGIVYQEKKQFDLSIKSFKKCIEIMPDYAEAHLNLALCYLLIGDYKNGWKEYEWRRKILNSSYDNLKKEWTGQSLKNKTLLILDEGDANLVHFIRFAKELKKDDCKIIVQCSHESNDLISKQKWIDGIVSDSNFPEHDYYVYIGSIMNILQFNPNENYQQFPYLRTDIKEHENIKKDKINIGLVLETDRSSNAHDDESIDSNLMNKLFDKKYNIICLDKYIKEDEIESPYSCKINYSNLNEFSQIVSSLDLVITVDHIAAHMAGALNIKTLLLLPCVPNWRWEISHRSTSPWYDSITIFRQDVIGDWNSVINRMKEYLNEIKDV